MVVYCCLASLTRSTWLTIDINSSTSSATFPIAHNRSFFFELCFKLRIWWWSRGALSKSLNAKSLYISERDCFWLRRSRISDFFYYFGIGSDIFLGSLLCITTRYTTTWTDTGIFNDGYMLSRYFSGRFSNQLAPVLYELSLFKEA